MDLPDRPGPPTSGGADDFLPLRPAKRCLGCYYVLDHLPIGQCPECGRPFDRGDPATYTTKPPFLWWRFWLPGFGLAVGLGLVTYALLVRSTGFGWATTLAIPVMIGGIVGYSGRLGKAFSLSVGWLALIACLVGLVAGGAGGVFCTLVLIAMAAFPLMISVLAGIVLRALLKRSNWGQREWLPVLALALLPYAVAFVESRVPGAPAVVVETSRVIDAPIQAAWDGVMFYEEVAGDPPWLLRLGLRRPLYTTGQVARVGDRRTCVYSRGRLTKQVTARRPLEALEFAVVEQDMFEDYSVRLTGGSFRFTPVGATRTRVTLTTRYEPLLRPRWAWQPVEEHVVHLLHGHVLDGMAEEARVRAAVRRDGVDAGVADGRSSRIVFPGEVAAAAGARGAPSDVEGTR